MRRTVFAVAFCAGAVCAAGASVPVTEGAFPRDAASLRELDSRQLRIVRRAGAMCWHSGEGGFGSRSVRARACVIGSTEGAMANSHDPALQGFHQALPFNARYNEYRPAYYWQRMVAGR